MDTSNAPQNCVQDGLRRFIVESGLFSCGRVCGDNALSVGGGRAVWPFPRAAGHIDEPVFTDSPI